MQLAEVTSLSILLQRGTEHVGPRVIYWAEVHKLARTKWEINDSKTTGPRRCKSWKAVAIRSNSQRTRIMPCFSLRTDTCFSWSQHVSKSIRENIYPPSRVHNPVRCIQQTYDFMCALKPNLSLENFWSAALLKSWIQLQEQEQVRGSCIFGHKGLCDIGAMGQT